MAKLPHQIELNWIVSINSIYSNIDDNCPKKKTWIKFLSNNSITSTFTKIKESRAHYTNNDKIQYSITKSDPPSSLYSVYIFINKHQLTTYRVATRWGVRVIFIHTNGDLFGYLYTNWVWEAMQKTFSFASLILVGLFRATGCLKIRSLLAVIKQILFWHRNCFTVFLVRVVDGVSSLERIISWVMFLEG